MQQEDRDRLTRVEMKIDQLLPIVQLVEKHDKHIFLMKWLGSVLVIAVGWALSFFGTKH